MIFKDWLKTQYKSGRLDKEEIEQAVGKLKEKVNKGIYSKSRFSKECYRNEKDSRYL